jgi:hypothetical protein
MQVLSFVQGELAQVPKDGFTDILVKDSKAQEFRRSWTTAVNNAEIIFENVNILNRDIQEHLHLLFEIPGEWERISHCLNEIQVRHSSLLDLSFHVSSTLTNHYHCLPGYLPTLRALFAQLVEKLCKQFSSVGRRCPHAFVIDVLRAG